MKTTTPLSVAWLFLAVLQGTALPGFAIEKDIGRSIKAIQLDGHWQLFLDDYIIARATGLDRVVHHPQAMGLVLPADQPWESFGCAPQYIGRKADGTFFCLYHAFWWDTLPQARIEEDRAHDLKDSLAYATSEDGIHWTKPNLGLVEGPAGIDWEKFPPFPFPKGVSKENNLILFGGNPLAQSRFSIWDLKQHGNVNEPQKRYAIFLNEKGYFASELPDFLNDSHWQEKLTSCGGTFSPRWKSLHFWDDKNEEWVALTQNAVPHWLPAREVARFSSKDMVHWGSEIVLAPDTRDSHAPESYGEPMEMLPYCAEGVVFGLLSWFYSDRVHPDGGPILNKSEEHPYIWPWARKGINEMRITLSRDGGRTWDRTSSREAWIPCGTEEDSYDRMVIYPSPPLFVGNEDWFYITVLDGNHLVIRNSTDQMPYYHDRVVKHHAALYIQKHNRYVSLRARNQKTVLITKPLTFDGKGLQLNVEANRGLLRVAIASAEPVETLNKTTLSMAPHLAEERPIAGFSFADCEPIQSNSVEQLVHFKEGSQLENLRGRKVRLLFEMTDADLYGFRIH